MRNILKYIDSRHLITDSIWRIEISRNILKGSCWFERGKQGQAALRGRASLLVSPHWPTAGGVCGAGKQLSSSLPDSNLSTK